MARNRSLIILRTQIPIKALTDIIALRRDSNFSSFPAEVLFLTSSSLTMSVSISEPRSRAYLKKSSVEFNVGIGNRAAIERERALEAVNRISGIQRG
jgi:hypothetical protein